MAKSNQTLPPVLPRPKKFSLRSWIQRFRGVSWRRHIRWLPTSARRAREKGGSTPAESQGPRQAATSPICFAAIADARDLDGIFILVIEENSEIATAKPKAV